MMKQADLSIAGRLVLDEGVPARGEIVVAGGRISAVSIGEPRGGLATKSVDVGDAYVLPGAIDCHVHSGSHPGEGLAAVTAAAAAGGVTTVVDMPYDAAGPVVSPEAFAEKSWRVARESLVDVALLGTVRPGSGAHDVAPLVEAGVAGFKLSLFCTDPRRFPRIPDHQFIEVLEAIREAGSIACVHAENEEIIKPLIERARHAGESSPIAHCRSRPPVSETQAVLTALEYARETRARLHLCHLSLPRSVDLVTSYAAEGASVSAETCPHYLCFSEDDMTGHGGRLKINPPLRRAADVEGMRQRVAAGRVDVVASDHAPWPLSSKTLPDIFDNHSGTPGVETLVTVLADRLLRQGGTVHDLVQLVATRPAKLFGLSHRKGSLGVGADADLVAYDPSAKFTLDEHQLHSNAGWSPYNDMTFRGRVVLTVARGEIVWDGASLHGAPGRGQLVRPMRDGGSDG